ncbi:MAG: Uma2 family endonuclease [Spirosomataceae bacterium]
MDVAVLEKPKRKPARKIPSYLIYEVMDGKPIYYKGYKEVLSGEKTIDEIMPSSFFQSLIVMAISYFLKSKTGKKFYVLSNEIGVSVAKKDSFANDIALFAKSEIANPQSEKYANIPPRVVIEVDTKADMGKFESPDEYFYRKTQKMLDFGVEKVIWVMTGTRKIMIAENQKPWLIVDWNVEIDVMDDIKFTLTDLLKEEGIE